MPRITRAAAVAGALGVGAYPLVEPFRFRLRTFDAPVRASFGLDVLHISDTHMSGGDKALASFLGSLPERLGRLPDLVVATGDFVEGEPGIDAFVEAVAPLEARLGRFYVFGSHDRYVSQFGGYLKYFSPRRRERARPLDTQRLEEGLAGKGWIGLTNTTRTIESPYGPIRLTGVDDPYLNRHRTDHIHRAPGDALALALVHAPNIVTEWALNGYDMVFAGHTHAGQVRAPGIGALVTNCALPTALAGGLHRIGSTWLHVSPGLGTGRFAPIRFNCRPEATLLRLHPES